MHFEFLTYGGPQLTRQKLIPRSKRKLLTAKENYPWQKEKTHGKKKNLAAKRKTLRQKEKPYGKKKNLTAKKKKTPGKKKNLAAKRKTSRQKEKDSRQKEKHSRQKEKLIRSKRKKGMGVGRVFRSTPWEKKAVKRGVIGLQDSYLMFSLANLYQSLNRFTCFYILVSGYVVEV